MRTVILGHRPPEIEALIESRRATGADHFDEVWEGDYHMAPSPLNRHGYLVAEFIGVFRPLARSRGLVVTDQVNIGVPDDFRIPDVSVQRGFADLLYLPTVALLVEVLSPHDETWEKLPFYAARGVDEVVVADPEQRTVVWIALAEGEYVPAEHSAVFDVPVAELVAQIEWPPVG